jgi:hypothetical protein
MAEVRNGKQADGELLVVSTFDSIFGFCPGSAATAVRRLQSIKLGESNQFVKGLPENG